MKTKHTPGEWTIDNSEAKGFRIVPNGDDSQPIAKLYNESPGSIEANAKLIAAAPKLLKDHLSDVTMIEELIKDLKDGKKRDVIYFLENLLVSKKSVIKKATE